MAYRRFIATIFYVLIFACFASAQEVADEKKEVPADKLVTYPGGDAALDNFIKANLSTTNLAVTNNITGTVIIKYIIDENGLAGDYTVLKSLGYGCDEQAIRVLKMMPRWEPGEIRGRKIKSTLQQTFYFTPQLPAVTVEAKVERQLKPDAPEEFGDKSDDLQAYLQQHFVFPASIKKDVPGVIMIKFRINTYGRADDIQVISGLHETLDNEVIRVIQAMPAWKAKQVNYRPADAYRQLTIGFIKKKLLFY